MTQKFEYIGVNAARVAGVATPQYLICRGRFVLTTPNILKLVNLLTVNIYEVCGDTDLPVCIVR